VAEQIALGVSEEWRSSTIDLFGGLLEQASEGSHGFIIAVLENSDDAFDKLKARISNGIFLPEPIDVAKYMIESLQTNDSNAQMSLRSVCAVVKRMIGHDGITIFSPSGQLFAYNLFVQSNDDETRNTIGGARSRAFQTLCIIPEIACALFRSQDGAMRVYKK
jgi:hypothetical protein